MRGSTRGRTRRAAGYQLIQGLIAIGSGGWFGTGLGTSRAKWDFLPNAHSDFIFAVIGEELGLLGALVVLVAFGVLHLRRGPDRDPRAEHVRAAAGGGHHGAGSGCRRSSTSAR